MKKMLKGIVIGIAGVVGAMIIITGCRKEKITGVFEKNGQREKLSPF